jgi:hypothetical protein
VIDHHVDRPDVYTRQRVQLTGPNRPIGSISVVPQGATPCMEIIPRPPDPRLRIGRHIRSCECDPGRFAAVKWHRHFARAKRPGPPTIQRRTYSQTRTAFTLDPGLAFRRDPRVDWTTWWSWRGAYTRSHPELGREMPQRPWYCVLRHGRVGRRQVFQSTPTSSGTTMHRFPRHAASLEDAVDAAAIMHDLRLGSFGRHGTHQLPGSPVFPELEMDTIEALVSTLEGSADWHT